MSSPEQREDKALVRRRFLALRAGLGAEAEALSQRIQDALAAEESYRDASAVMVYIAFRGEVRTDRLISEGLRRGVAVTAPLVVASERRLVPYRLRGRPGELKPGAYGIMEPDPHWCDEYPAAALDLIVVPGVAFDRGGGRLGYGGGYYDRFLSRGAAAAMRVAPAFDLQVSSEPLPLGPHDVRMDYIVTESGVLKPIRGNDHGR